MRHGKAWVYNIKLKRVPKERTHKAQKVQNEHRCFCKGAEEWFVVLSKNIRSKFWGGNPYHINKKENNNPKGHSPALSETTVLGIHSVHDKYTHHLQSCFKGLSEIFKSNAWKLGRSQSKRRWRTQHTWPSCPAMASWRHHERTRPGPEAAQRHGRGLGLTDPSRRLTSRRAESPAPEAAVPLRVRPPTPPNSTRPRGAGSGRREGTAQTAMGAEAPFQAI